MQLGTKHLPANVDASDRVEPINTSNATQLATLLRKHKISASEYQTLLSILGRSPTFAELGVFSSMWSEHCSYKSSRVHLKRFPTTGLDVIQGPGENAGIVRLAGKLGVAFKMESHNHPSYIEPYQGAATGVGGILRDVFCMGARPIANLNCLRFGAFEHQRTSYLYEHVVKGIGDYGNCIGVPTVGGNISFDRTYDGNCLVNAMTVGLINEDQIFKGYASGVGNIVIYVGSSTGRDGIHGATMASDSFDSKTAGERSAVQVGDPFTEKLLLEATLEVLATKLVVGLQDMGAAGLTSSSFEMASRAESGLYLNLDLVPTRTEGMSAYELLLSESQERMLMVAEESQWPALKAVFEKWQLAHAVIGVVTDTKRVQATRYGKLEIDIPVAPITDLAPKYERPITHSEKPQLQAPTNLLAKIDELGLQGVLDKMYSIDPAKDKVFTQYDRHIGSRTVLESEHEGAAVMWIREPETESTHPYLGLGIATACNERYCALDSHYGGAHAVLKAARMLYAVGARPLALTDCLNYGNPEDPRVMAQFADGVDGISEAASKLSIPVVSGNVSLYNETDGQNIYPTPMIGVVGRVDDVRQVRPAVLKQNARVLLLCPQDGATYFGGSLLGKVLSDEGLFISDLPPIDYEQELIAAAFIREQISRLLACRDVAAGGVGLTLSKMVRRHNFSFEFAKRDFASPAFLFGERSCSYLLAASAEVIGELKAALPSGFALIDLGHSVPAVDESRLYFV